MTEPSGLVPGYWRTVSKTQAIFNYPEIYDAMVTWARDGVTFVELGSWLGQSACFMGERIALSGKRIRFVCYDLWTGRFYRGVSQSEADQRFIERFEVNIRGAGLVDVVEHRRSCSDAAQFHEDGSVDFLWIDADHSYNGVQRDLRAWWPKIRPNGVIAGHDYTLYGCGKGVDDFFAELGLTVTPVGKTSWMYRLDDQEPPLVLRAFGLKQKRRLVPPPDWSPDEMF